MIPVRPGAAIPAIDSAATDSIPVDSVAADSPDSVPQWGVTLTPPAPPHYTERPDTPASSQWLGGALVVIFILFCLRCKKNLRFMGHLFTDLTSVKERNSMFDDTVNETAFLWLLSGVCAFTTGLLLYQAVCLFEPSTARSSLHLWLCVACSTAYCLLMPAAYWVAGITFGSLRQTRQWVRGFAASQSLLGLASLLPALLCLYYPEWTAQLLIFAAILIILAKIMFISKGFRIFFNQIASWLLFLYYLCSLEIIPLILSFAAASALCALI